MSTLVSGRGNRWLFCDHQAKSCRRHDDGRLLKRRDGAFLTPVTPPKPATDPALKVSRLTGFQTDLTLADGAAMDRMIGVLNEGGPAYRAQFRGDAPPEAASSDASLQSAVLVGVLDPVVRLDGDSAVTPTPLRLIARTSELNPRAGRVRVPLTLTHAHGAQSATSMLREVDRAGEDLVVSVLAPELALTSATLQAPADDDAPYTLVARVDNLGGLASGALTATLELKTDGDVSDHLSADQRIISDPVPAEGGRDLIFAFPQAVFGERAPDQLIATLQMRTRNHIEAPDVVFHRYLLTAPVAIPGGGTGAYVAAAAIVAALLLSSLIVAAPRIPAVARVSADPDALFQVPVERLPRLRSLLLAARRRADVLEAAGVPKRRFDDVSGFPKAPVGEKLRMLAERLRLRTSPLAAPPGLTILDAETPDQLMLNLPRLRLVGVDPGLTAEAALSAYTTSGISRDLLAFFVSGDAEQRRELEKAVGPSGEFAAVASGEDLTRMLLSDEPLDAFARSISRQVRATRISAYQSGGGVSQAAAFFGREAELRDVLNRSPANYFLIGARQVGKSSFLKEVERRAAALGQIEAHYCTLSDDDLGGPLCDALGLAERSVEAAVAHLGAPDAPKRMLLVDEADLFIRAESARDYETLRTLRRLTEEGRAYFVFAGFWHLYRSITAEFHSPLKNFGQLIVLEGLEPEAARDLITKPMSALGLRYRTPDLVEEIRRRTGARANLMAIVCDEILKAAPPELRVIETDHVAEALASTPLRSALQGWAEMSGRDAPEANRLDQIIVYATAGDEGFTAAALERRLRDKGLSVSGAALREALTRLEIGYVVSRGADKQHRYRVPLFVEMIQDYDQEVELEDLIRQHQRKG